MIMQKVSIYLHSSWRAVLVIFIYLASQLLFADESYKDAMSKCEEFSNQEFSMEESEAIKVLINGGNISNLCVDAIFINYTREVCVTAGRNPNFNKRFTTCPLTDFSIARKGLNVRGYGREPRLTGTPVVRIEGKISREMHGNFDEYSITVRRDLERNFYRRERGNRTNFPVLGNYPQSKISNALRALSKN